jgi:LDH2 family malate/lactate/ureidoglycolate dehydrogenase
MDNWVNRFKSAKPIDSNQPVIIPGEPELAAEIERTKNGIPLVNAVIEDLNLLADKFGIKHLS